MTLAWAVWAGVAVASFLVLEVTAIVTKESGDTLSANLRRWLGIKPHKPYALAGIAVFVGFLGWLAVHIVFGILP